MRNPREPLPVVLMHVRLTSIGVDVDQLEALKDDLKVFLDKRAELWGLRVKRRIVSREMVTALFASYQALAALTEEQAREKRRARRKKKPN